MPVVRVVMLGVICSGAFACGGNRAPRDDAPGFGEFGVMADVEFDGETWVFTPDVVGQTNYEPPIARVGLYTTGRIDAPSGRGQPLRLEVLLPQGTSASATLTGAYDVNGPPGDTMAVTAESLTATTGLQQTYATIDTRYHGDTPPTFGIGDGALVDAAGGRVVVDRLEPDQQFADDFQPLPLFLYRVSIRLEDVVLGRLGPDGGVFAGMPATARVTAVFER